MDEQLMGAFTDYLEEGFFDDITSDECAATFDVIKSNLPCESPDVLVWTLSAVAPAAIGCCPSFSEVDDYHQVVNYLFGKEKITPDMAFELAEMIRFSFTLSLKAFPTDKHEDWGVLARGITNYLIDQFDLELK